jgi:hypothetical protein
MKVCRMIVLKSFLFINIFRNKRSLIPFSKMMESSFLKFSIKNQKFFFKTLTLIVKKKKVNIFKKYQ